MVVTCLFCNSSFVRKLNKINEGKKFGWKTYCSLKCLGLSRQKGKLYSCSRLGCTNIFIRSHNFKKSKKVYCSHRCFAVTSNKESPRKIKILRACFCCGKPIETNKKYCCVYCKNKSTIISTEEIMKSIKEFTFKNKRIPFKKEFSHSKAARLRFGSWNNAIVAAGFTPNPVRFSKKHIALDGHKCDSLAEKIIDDYLFRRKIKHKRNYPYPGKKGFTVDFKVGDKWIEFFGLSGQLERYDHLMKMKLELVKKYDLTLVSIYPKDMFPIGKLEEVLSFI